MLRTAVLASLLGSLTVFSASAADQPAKKPVSDQVVILREVDSLTSLLSDGVAGPGAEPKILFGPDGDAFVLFDMESWSGSNSLTQYVAIFTKVDTTGWQSAWRSHRYSLAAFMELGAGQQDWEFEADDLSVDMYDIITVKGLTWGPKDAHCCPSIHKNIKVKYSAGSFTYLKE